MSTSSEGEGDGAGRGLKLFVRNTDAYFYFGTHTGCGTRGERVWVVHGVSLKEGTPLKTTNNNQASPAKRKGGEGGKGDMAKLTMQQITSKALGADTSFFIHNGYFYGLTIMPQDQLNDPHVSTYTSIRFPLESPTADAVETGSRVFRRHHGVEGPINDAWTALGAVVDETSGEARVIEERREWGQGMGTQGAGRSAGGERSWYFETLGFGEANDSSERGDDDEEEEEEEEEEGMTTSDGPGWDDSSSVSARSLSPTGSLRASAGNGADALHSYTLSRTKSRAYNYSARTFLDLVEDEQCCPDGLCLRLRVGARRERTQRGDETQIVHEDRPGGGEMQRQDQVFVHKRVRMWPAASSSLPGEGRAGCRCSQNPHAIVNAPLQRCRTRSSFSPAQAVDIVAATDERSIVFLRRPKYGGGRGRTGPLVLLSFDEGISARGLDGLSWKKEQCCSCR
ncbi:hypothetical protein IWX49DRAFT_508862 [Phyllosticta citricarpa]|uniref:Uncharacterized protein n=1 Tax=Phyllosticta citricarpa TaxID=55181 RepID=A0ABR1LVN9_9PEZI